MASARELIALSVNDLRAPTLISAMGPNRRAQERKRAAARAAQEAKRRGRAQDCNTCAGGNGPDRHKWGGGGGVGAAIGTGALWGEQRAAKSPLRRGARQLYFGVRRDGTIEFSPKW